MISSRRYPRYPCALRLRLQLPQGELETSTEEISLAGFSAQCASLPETGTRFTFAVHLPDDTVVTGTAAAVRISDKGLAGFSLEFGEREAAAWAGFIQQEHGQGGVWRMLSRWVSGGAGDGDEVGSVREKGATGALRLHMVGENGEAYRIAFEKHPSEPPDKSAFAQASPRVLDFAKRAISRILVHDVLLKRTPTAPVEPVRLVEMLNGGYGYLFVQAGGKPGLMGLHGSELIVVEEDAKLIFPFFTADDLERIAADSFRREADTKPSVPVVAAPPPAVQEERFSQDYAHQHVDTQNLIRVSHTELKQAMSRSERMQTRTYGARTLKLFPDVWIEVQRPGVWADPVRGFAMQDGAALCIFVLVGKGAPRVVKLEGKDHVFNIRGGPAG
ncbi:MAG: PilZ domain-containing protein [Myxococcaceae bacterium]|nr:PilZ domain-containing protein [Myxococcaceae bacterium]